VVVRGGVEPPTFRFSGLGITVQDRPQRSLWLVSDLRCTPIVGDARGCMRLEMRLIRSTHPSAGLVIAELRQVPWHSQIVTSVLVCVISGAWTSV
jgi:hypothetical protein